MNTSRFPHGLIYFCLGAITLSVASSVLSQEFHRLLYDPTTGNLTLDVPDSVEALTTFDLKSRAKVFVGERPVFTDGTPGVLDGAFDVFNDGQIFRLGPTGFRTTDFGSVLPTGLDAAVLADDLCAAGSLRRGGSLPELTIGFDNTHVPLSGCKPPPRELDPIELHYEYTTGNLSLLVEDGLLLSSLIVEANEFVGSHPTTLSGDFDVFSANRIFKMDLKGFAGADFGPVLPAGKNHRQLNLCVSATKLDGSFHQVSLAGTRIPPCTGQPLPHSVGRNYFQPSLPLAEDMHATDDVYRLTYSPSDGSILFDVPGSLPNVTTLEVKSLSGVFTGTRPTGFNEEFKVFNREKLFDLRPDGMGSTNYGPIATPNLTPTFLASDLCVRGSRIGGGELGSVLVGHGDSYHPITGCQAINNGDGDESIPIPVQLKYDTSTGGLSVDVDDQIELAALLLESERDVFRPLLAGESLPGPFDIRNRDQLFIFNANGFNDVVLGNVFPVGLSRRDLASFCGTALDANGNSFSILLNGNLLKACHKDLAETEAPRFQHPGVVPPYDQGDKFVIYDPGSGDLLIFYREMTTLEIRSKNGLFQGDTPPELGGLFNEFSAERIFKLSPNSFDELYLPGVLPIGLQDIASEISIAGSCLRCGGIAGFTFHEGPRLPETTTSLPFLGVLMLLTFQRRRHKTRASAFHDTTSQRMQR